MAAARAITVGCFLFVFTVGGAAAQRAPDSFADLAEKLLPSVVNISTVQTIEARANDGPRAVPQLPPGSPFQDFFDQFFGQRNDGENAPPRRTVSLGSGFFISEDGLVVTNNHVIGEADEITVTTDDGTEYDAEILGRDAEQDLVLLKVDGHGFHPLKFGDSSKLRVGDWVVAIGNPFGLGGSVTAGIVSGLQRNINAGNFDYFIQTDASINRGNSGGPMFDLEGEVVGVNTMIFSPNGGNIGIGFAIPSNDVHHIIDQLREYGRARRGWIGVTIQSVTDEIADSLGLTEARGAIVGSVVPGGPSDKAGIKPGDIILAFNGQDVKTSQELPRVVSNVGIGKEVEVDVLRDGDHKTFHIETGERPQPEDQVALAPTERPVPGSVSNESILGMNLSPVTPSLQDRFDLPEDVHGVVISGLSRSSEAAVRGLRPGDVIVQVNQEDVDSTDKVDDIISKARDENRTAILLRIYRDGAYFHLPLPLSDAG